MPSGRDVILNVNMFIHHVWGSECRSSSTPRCNSLAIAFCRIHQQLVIGLTACYNNHIIDT